jgi:hypothetical protein
MFKIKTEIVNEENIIHLLRVDGDTVWNVPQHDPANTDYQAYLAWVAEGNTAEEWTGE